MLLILLMMTSLLGFSQSVTDSTSIQLKKPIVKLVIKDLILGDGAKKELILTNSKVNLLRRKIILKDSIIFNLNSQVGNFETIMFTKANQLDISQQLTKRLQIDLKKQRIKTKLMGGAGLITAVVAILLLK
jgi:hypothetical protein